MSLFPSRFSRWALSAALLLSTALANAQAPADGQKKEPEEPTLRVDVDLVNILFSVRAKHGGQLISNLNKDDFEVYEDKKKQTIQHFSRDTDLPLTLGLLIDISASQQNLIDVEQHAASSFFSNVIRPKDEAFLISFGRSTDLLEDFTNSPRTLQSALGELRPDSGGSMMGGGPIPNTGPVPTSGRLKGTLLYDAIYLAATEKLRSEVGRKAIVLITDGDDQGSYYNRKAAVEAAQRSDTIIYSIYYVDHYFYASMGLMAGGGGESDLKKMSDETGGRVFTVDSRHTLQDVFREIQDEMRNQYAIGYVPGNGARDGSFRKIEIRADKSEYKVQARSGYYATPNDAK